MTPTISAALIVRNGGEMFRRCLESVRPQVDELVVVVTHPKGEQDETFRQDMATAIDFQAVIRTFEWVDDFSAARNVSFQHASGDWLLWLDADDVIEGDLRKLVSELPEGVGGVMIPYDYAHLNGQAAMQFDRERLVRRDIGWTWQNPIHEVLAGQQDVQWARSDDVRIVHQRDAWGERRTASIDRNLRILNAWYEREPEHHRVAWYLGMQYHAMEEWAESARWFERSLPHLNNVADKWQALCYQGRSFLKLQNWRLATGAALRALAAEPRWPDPYLILAECAVNQRQWEQALHYIGQAESADPPPPYVFTNPLHYSFDPKVFKQVALSELGYVEEALAVCDEALAIMPSDRLTADKRSYEAALRQQRSLDAALWLYEDLTRNDEVLKARDLYKLLPYTIKQRPEVREAHERAQYQASHLSSNEAYKAFYTDNPEWAAMPDDVLMDWCEAMPRVQWVVERLKARGATTIIDIGCSDGFVSAYLAQQGFTVLGIDIDPRCIERAQQRAQDWGIADRCTFRVAMFEELDPAELGHFDAALIMEVLEHVPTPQHTLACAERVADAILITVPNGAFEQGALDEWAKPEQKGHVRVFTQRDLEILVGSLPSRHILELHDAADRWLVCEYDQVNILDRPPVSIYCGPGLEPWGPWSPDTTGIGGSETAVIQMAKELTARGMRVSVHAEAHGVYDGVFWRHYSHFEPRDVLLWVSWRSPGHVYANEGGSAEQKWLWVHDWLTSDVLTETNAAEYDRIIALSEAHRKHLADRYPFAAAKLVVAGNGIDPARFEGLEQVQREPHRYVWSNSPDRGLDWLLEQVWPLIRAKQPDAELHVCYGFDNIEKLKGRRPELRAFLDRLTPLLSQPGVVLKGRLNQRQLAEEFARAHAWVYPSRTDGKRFFETYCISALEAQAAGCIPITPGHGALSETVPEAPHLFFEDEPERWAEAATTEYGKAYRERLRAWALGQTWSAVADRWVELIKAAVSAGA